MPSPSLRVPWANVLACLECRPQREISFKTSSPGRVLSRTLKARRSVGARRRLIVIDSLSDSSDSFSVSPGTDSSASVTPTSLSPVSCDL